LLIFAFATTTKLHEAHTSKIVGEGLTYDDVLLIQIILKFYREFLYNLKFQKNITLNDQNFPQQWIQLQESAMLSAMAQEGGMAFYTKHDHC
jgi:IMP dehydrogenase